MRVLLITFSDNADHQDITFGMFEELCLLNKDVWLMAGKEPRVGLKKGEHVKLVNCPKRPGIERKTFDVKSLLSIIRWINSKRFDVIFFESIHVWNLLLMVLCHKNACIYQVIHDFIPHFGDKHIKAVYLMNKIICKLADIIVLFNRKYLEKLTELYKIPQSRVAYINMWRRFPTFTEPRYTGRVLFFGRINPYKGVDNLLEIVRLCKSIQFDVVGRIDIQVKEAVEELGKESNVTLNNGYVTNEDMERVFINADWVILPYHSATQSGVVIDAYRYARPVVAFDVGAISEQIKHGISGYLIPPDNNKEFALKLLEVVQMDKDDYKKMCRGAYEFGVNKYAANRAVERFENLIGN